MDKYLVKLGSPKNTPSSVNTSTTEDAENIEPESASPGSKANEDKMLINRLKTRVKFLEEKVMKLERENCQLKKRPSSSTNNGTDDLLPKKSKTEGQKKKLFEKWSNSLTKECKKAKVNNYCGGSADVSFKDTLPWNKSDFEEMFVSQLALHGGILIQPTKDNKPTSVITILSYDSYEKIENLFGKNVISKTQKIPRYRRRNFQKSYKVGDAIVEVERLEVSFHRSKLHLEFKFQLGATDCDGDFDDASNCRNQ